MKRLLLCAAVCLLALPALAKKAELKILENTKTDAGYAIAWGVKGERIDFDELEESEDALEKLKKDKLGKIANFLVYREKEDSRIVKLVSGLELKDRAHAEVKDELLGENYYRLGVVEVEANGLKSDQDVLIVTQDPARIDTKSIYVVTRNGDKATLNLECKTCANMIDAALTKANLKAEMETFIKDSDDIRDELNFTTSEERGRKIVNFEYKIIRLEKVPLTDEQKADADAEDDDVGPAIVDTDETIEFEGKLAINITGKNIEARVLSINKK